MTKPESNTDLYPALQEAISKIEDQKREIERLRYDLKLIGDWSKRNVPQHAMSVHLDYIHSLVCRALKEPNERGEDFRLRTFPDEPTGECNCNAAKWDGRHAGWCASVKSTSEPFCETCQGFHAPGSIPGCPVRTD